MLAAVVIACIAVASPSQGTANLSGAPCIRSVKQISDELYKADGIRLSISDELVDQLIFLRSGTADGVTVAQAVASALHATLQGSGNQLSILRTGSDREKITNERAAARLGWLNRKIDGVIRFRKQALASGNPTSAFVAQSRLRAEKSKAFFAGDTKIDLGEDFADSVLPAEQLLLETVDKIGRAELAKIPNGLARVYENTRLATSDVIHPIPNDDELLDSYRKLIEGLPLLKLTQEEIHAAIVSGVAIDPNIYAGGYKLPSTLRLRVIASKFDLRIELEGYDAKGDLALTSFLVASNSAAQRNPEVLSAATPGETAGGMEPLDQAAVSDLSFAKGLDTRVRPNWFSNPDRFEPMEAFVGKVLDKLYPSVPGTSCQAIAVTDDLFPLVARSCNDKFVNLHSLRQTLVEWYPQVVRSGPNFASAVPQDFTGSTAEHNHPRRALASFVAQSSTTDSLMRDTCRLYSQALPGDVSPLGTDWPALLLTVRGIPQSRGYLLPKLGALLGTLSDDDWSSLLAGRLISADSLSQPELLSFLASDPPTNATAASARPNVHPLEVFLEARAPKIAYRAFPIYFFADASKAPPDHLHPIEVLFAQTQITGKNSVQTVNGVPTVSVTRADFEHRFETRRFKLAFRKREEVQLLLNSAVQITASVEGPMSLSPEVLSYAELPVALRDMIWASACKTTLAVYADMQHDLEAAKKQGTVGEPTGTGPTQKP